jgi:hypothetical protein
MNVTYRTDWLSHPDLAHSQIDVMHFESDLKAAERMARKMSKVKGAAYVIRSVNGKDVAHVYYTDGVADREWEA